MKVMHHEIGRDMLYKVWNTIDGAMIIYTYTDGGSIVFADEIFPIQKGALCFIGPSTRHYTMPEIPSKYDRSKIFVPMETVQRLLNAVPSTSGIHNLFLNNSVIYAKIPTEVQDKIENIFQKAADAEGRQEGAEEITVCAFFELMVYLKEYTVLHTEAPNDFLSGAIEYINSNYSKKISLEDICENVHISKYHLCRRFKETVGMTVMEYVQETRVAAAKSMLANSNLRIEEISEQCGFGCLSYFSQIFKQRTGISATQYRKSAR